jgi:hypothetical protein
MGRPGTGRRGQDAPAPDEPSNRVEGTPRDAVVLEGVLFRSILGWFRRSETIASGPSSKVVPLAWNDPDSLAPGLATAAPRRVASTPALDYVPLTTLSEPTPPCTSMSTRFAEVA